MSLLDSIQRAALEDEPEGEEVSQEVSDDEANARAWLNEWDDMKREHNEMGSQYTQAQVTKDVKDFWADVEEKDGSQVVKLLREMISGRNESRRNRVAAHEEGECDTPGSCPEHDVDFADQAVEDIAACPTCGAENAPMGTLGKRVHYRCRDCGMDYSNLTSSASGRRGRAMGILDELIRSADHVEPGEKVKVTDVKDEGTDKERYEVELDPQTRVKTEPVKKKYPTQAALLDRLAAAKDEDEDEEEEEPEEEEAEEKDESEEEAEEEPLEMEDEGIVDSILDEEEAAEWLDEAPGAEESFLDTMVDEAPEEGEFVEDGEEAVPVEMGFAEIDLLVEGLEKILDAGELDSEKEIFVKNLLGQIESFPSRVRIEPVTE